MISEPSSILLTFYYYYTFLTLILCWYIVPFLFYAILTKSKNLGKFKWLIFYYSFWSLCVTSLMGLCKPLIFFPALAGIQYGIFRNLFSYQSTIIEIILFLVFYWNCFFGLCLTLAYRYLLVFPTTKLKKWFTIKIAIILMIFLPNFPYIIITIIFIQIFKNLSTEKIHIWALEYDGMVENYFINEKTLVSAPYYSMDIPSKVAIIFFILGYFLSFFILISLRYQMKKYQSKILSKINRSLILSSLVQIILTCGFFLTPGAIFLLIIAFQIPNTSSLIVILFCILNTHCLADFIVTLYFIIPYRKFIIGLFKKTPNRLSIITIFQVINNKQESTK